MNTYIIPSQTSLRGHSKKLYKKRLKKDVVKYSIPDRAIDKWNTLPGEVVCVKSIHSFKEKYDEMVSKYETKRAALNPVKIQLGKNTHTHTHTSYACVCSSSI